MTGRSIFYSYLPPDDQEAAGSVGFEDPVDDDEDRGPSYSTPRFSRDAVETYNWVVNRTQDVWGIPTRTEIKGRIDDLARAMYYEFGGTWPSGPQLMSDPRYGRAMDVYASGTPFLLPAMFTVDGRLYYNDPMTGPSHVRGRAGAMARTSPQLMSRVPEIPRDTLNEILVGYQQGRRRGGGGRGGGGGGRPDLVFDQAQLNEQARTIWRDLMLEEPGDVTDLVNGFVKEANSFWRKDGGRLDFQTYITNQARDTGRYKNLYRKKPEFMSEAEYMGQFRQTAAGFGLSASETLRQVEAGATSGASLTGFSARVQRGRENLLNQQGGFSQRLANNLNQLGAIGRS